MSQRDKLLAKILIGDSDGNISEDEAYLAEIPELPGCMADGETYRTVLENVQVVQEWIDMARELGREIPRPQAN